MTEAFSPWACVADVSRRHDVSVALIYMWRRKFHDAQAEAALPALPNLEFAEAVVLEADDAPSADRRPVLVVALAKGRRLEVFSKAAPALVATVLKALR